MRFWCANKVLEKDPLPAPQQRENIMQPWLAVEASLSGLMERSWSTGVDRPRRFVAGAGSSSEEALQALFMLQSFFRLPLRALEGFSRSILALLEVDLPVPDYSTLCRRRQNLEGELGAVPRPKDGKPLHLVIDSSGLKVFGEGEW